MQSTATSTRNSAGGMAMTRPLGHGYSATLHYDGESVTREWTPERPGLDKLPFAKWEEVNNRFEDMRRDFGQLLADTYGHCFVVGLPHSDRGLVFEPGGTEPHEGELADIFAEAST